MVLNDSGNISSPQRAPQLGAPSQAMNTTASSPAQGSSYSSLPAYDEAMALPTAASHVYLSPRSSPVSSPRNQSPRAAAAQSPHAIPRGSQPGSNMGPPLVPADWELRKKDGRVYYADLTTRKTHWPPPKGWRVKKHTDGRLYYVHNETKSSHWHLPPPEWEICKSPAGSVYFFDKKTKEMHTKVPAPTSTAPTASPTASPVAKKKVIVIKRR